jgi:hypothetical protein
MTYTNETGKPIYLNADKSAVVEEGPDAAFLLVGPGGELPDDVAAQYGLKAAEKPAEEKAAEPAEDKAAEKPADKGQAAPRK